MEYNTYEMYENVTFFMFVYFVCNFIVRAYYTLFNSMPLLYTLAHSLSLPRSFAILLTQLLPAQTHLLTFTTPIFSLPRSYKHGNLCELWLFCKPENVEWAKELQNHENFVIILVLL